jgi:hypothetical protein
VLPDDDGPYNQSVNPKFLPPRAGGEPWYDVP